MDNQLAREKGTLVNTVQARSAETPLRINQNCHDVATTAHGVRQEGQGYAIGWCSDHDVPRYTVNLRQIGWIDQSGRVWLTSQDWQDAGGPNGSITPLLINPGCD